jgi:hypothetical protein
MTETEEWGPYRNGPANQISGEEWDIVCAVEQFWHTNRYFPSNKEISEETVTPVERVAELLESPAVKTRLEARGINYDASPPAKKGELKKNLTRLTDKQLATAMCILNVADTRSIQEKLRTLGVPEATYYGWTKSKVFQEFMETQMEDMFGDAMPLAHRALISKVVNGDMRAIKLFYELTGRYKSQENETVQNVKILVLRLIEILQRHIKDPVILQAVAEEIKGAIPEISNKG